MNRQELATGQFVSAYTPPKRCQSHKRALEVLARRIDHAGRVRLSHAQLGRAIGLCERQTQTVVHALQSAGVLRIDAQRGYANVYRVLVDWVLRLLAGEALARSAVFVTPGTAEPSSESLHPEPSPPHPPPRRMRTWAEVYARRLAAESTE